MSNTELHAFVIFAIAIVIALNSLDGVAVVPDCRDAANFNSLGLQTGTEGSLLTWEHSLQPILYPCDLDLLPLGPTGVPSGHCVPNGL